MNLHGSHASPGVPPQAECSLEEVLVLYAHLEQFTPIRAGLTATLAPGELARAAGFRSETDRSHFVLTHGLLRSVLGGCLSVAPRQVGFEYGRHGKPLLASGSAWDLQFNLSHSEGLAVFALACGRRVGIDVERLRPLADYEGVANRFFAREEALAIERLPPEARTAGFFKTWTRKEAYLKARGVGLSGGMHGIVVTLGPDEEAQAMRADDGAEWSLLGLAAPDGYVAALATEGAPPQVQAAWLRPEAGGVVLCSALSAP